jgi:hypothetical protein
VPNQLYVICKRILAIGTLTSCGVGLILFILGVNTKAIAEDFQSTSNISMAYTYTVFLPLLALQKPCDISGQATLNGIPVSGALFSLGWYFVLGSYAPDVYSTTSTADGQFCFTSVATLPCPGFFYTLGGKSISGTQPQGHYARSWGVAGFQRCDTSQVYRDFHAELSDITVITPPDDVTVTLPITFQWTHPGIEAAYYEIQFSNCSDAIIAGYTNTAVVNQIPACITAGSPVTWWVMEKASGYVASQIHTVTLETAK